MDSKRLRALKALTTLLEGVTSLSSSVYRGKSNFSEGDMPGVAILQTPPVQFPDTLSESTDTKESWLLYVHGILKAGDLKHPSDEGEALLAEVKQALGVLIPRQEHGQWLQQDLGGTITGFSMDSGTVFQDKDQRQDYAQFLLRVSLEFNEKKGDPYE